MILYRSEGDISYKNVLGVLQRRKPFGNIIGAGALLYRHIVDREEVIDYLRPRKRK